MAEMPQELRAALEADDAGEFAQLLRQRRPEDVEALRDLLSTEDDIPADHRTKAMYAFGQWREESVVPEIRRLLPGLDERGRIGALSALGRIGTPDSVEALGEHAEDPSPQVRKAAAVGLGRVGTPDARRRLTQMAQAESEPWLRDLATRSAS
ncbi:HEAT repeat protein [Lipingzhangella halophila]|uniref:HEAT repeat protein n=1 Tax=Lipingzhangella halophila TaxID=1783352 RepID=A0A7W7RMQ6_9ACTN|nr:HEAT repeat domain-containing protein [Lipingzhangella halophila]MBB4934848.1 HEAT repeat protein [Lipingzhangella halophila]